jgi:hypothetical protein
MSFAVVERAAGKKMIRKSLLNKNSGATGNLII